MLRHLLLLMVSAMLAAPEAARAADARVYEGDVGGSPVVMKLEVDGSSAYGAYFYRRTLFDIDLNGEVRGDALQLESRLTQDKLSLVPRRDGYAGTLTTSRGRSLPLALRPAKLASSRDAPDDLDGYERLRLSGLALAAGEAQTVAGRRIRWHAESRSGVSLFRLESGYAPHVLAAINQSLARAQWRRVAHYFGCPDIDDHAGLESPPPEEPYLSERFVSFAWPSSWSCAGAAHPDFGLEGHTFDAATGRELALDELLRFGPAAPPKPDTDAWYRYRSEVFAPAVVALMARLHPEAMKPASGEDCDYSASGVWDFPAWHVTEKGLYLGASFPRVARACDNPEWSFVPLSALKGR